MNANPQFFGTTTSESDLIRYATSLVPSLKSRTAEVDQLGRLPQATIDELSDGGLFALTTPRRYGGQQTSVRTFLEVVSELGRGDASTASHETPTARPGPRSCSLPGRNALAST